jgi:hippurate hydrolase
MNKNFSMYAHRVVLFSEDATTWRARFLPDRFSPQRTLASCWRGLRQLLLLCAAVALLLGSATQRGAAEHLPELRDWLQTETPQLTQLYQQLHRSPELSLEEEKTAARMAAQMTELGLEVTTEVGGHGVVAVLKNGSGKTLLLRADMDALPIAEATGLAYASTVKVKNKHGATVGLMHACGHDMHLTNLVGTVRYLASHRDQWQGTLVAIFQPAEEVGAGAKAMLEAGLLKRFPRPDFALAMHVAADVPSGTVEYLAGYSQANVDSVDITVHGRGGHGAKPESTVDPIVIAARLVLDLQTIVSREIAPIEPAVITVGSIHGGTKHNVIGDTCQLQLTVRSYSPEVRQKLLAGIQRKAQAAAQSAGAPEPEIAISQGTPSLRNDPDLVKRLVPVLKKALGEARVVQGHPSMGGEDFGRIGRAGIPIVMLKLGTVSQQRLDQYAAQDQPPPSLHSASYYPDPEASITTGVTTFVAAALELLQRST